MKAKKSTAVVEPSNQQKPKPKPDKATLVATEKHEIFDTRKVVKTLEGLMTQVTSQQVVPETVNAACNCADKIVDILRLHLDVERLRMKTPR